MGLAVELYFDARSEESVESLREEVHAAGIEPDPAFAGSRPHLTLAIVETDDSARLGEVVAAFARTAPRLSVGLAAISAFASAQGVLYLAPVPTIDLLDMHGRFHESLTAAGFRTRPMYAPGSWIPHCTLEVGLSGAQLTTAFDSCWRRFTPLEVELCEAGVVSFPPPLALRVVPLALPPNATSA